MEDHVCGDSAVVHFLLSRSTETVPVTLEDCPDLDIRYTVKLVCLIVCLVSKNDEVLSSLSDISINPCLKA